jgi:hypothetical protein
MPKIILAILFSLLLIVLGQYFFGDFYELLLPNVDGATYQTTDFSSEFYNSIIFSLALGLIPISLLLLWKLSKVNAINKKMLSVFIIIICMTLAVLIRQQTIKSHLQELTKSSTVTSNNFSVSYPIDKVNFEYYLLIGLFIGWLMSYLIFRQEKNYRDKYHAVNVTSDLIS